MCQHHHYCIACAAVVWLLDVPDIVAHTIAAGGDGLVCEHLTPVKKDLTFVWKRLEHVLRAR